MIPSDSTPVSNQPIPIVEVTALEKRFHLDGSAIEVLKSVDLTLHQGHSLAVVGPSGSGKSTFLHILGLLERLSGGEYHFLGRNATNLSDQERAQLRLEKIGFIFQFHHLLPEFTARENVMLPALMLGKSKLEADIQAGRLLAEVGLANRMNHRPGELSGGEQQRTALARAVVNSPALILADEPTGNLDGASAEMTSLLLKKISLETNAALVLVTHNLKLARTMDRMVLLKEGHLSATESSLDSDG